MAGPWSGDAKREVRAGRCCLPERDSDGEKESGANPREMVTALPAPVTMWRRTRFARFAPQLGAGMAKRLGSAVVVAPSSRKITQKIIGRSRRRGSGWR